MAGTPGACSQVFCHPIRCMRYAFISTETCSLYHRQNHNHHNQPTQQPHNHTTTQQPHNHTTTTTTTQQPKQPHNNHTTTQQPHNHTTTTTQQPQQPHKNHNNHTTTTQPHNNHTTTEQPQNHTTTTQQPHNHTTITQQPHNNHTTTTQPVRSYRQRHVGNSPVRTTTTTTTTTTTLALVCQGCSHARCGARQMPGIDVQKTAEPRSCSSSIRSRRLCLTTETGTHSATVHSSAAWLVSPGQLRCSFWGPAHRCRAEGAVSRDTAHN